MDTFDTIPVLDAGALHSGSEADLDTFADAFGDAYSTTGFGCIVNHGIDPALIDAVFAQSARFHALPLDRKMAVELDHRHRGYIPINTSTDVNSTLADVQRPNQSESFMVMREDGPDSPDVRAGAYLAGPNQWPDLDGFRTDVMAYHDALKDLGHRLMAVAVRALGADPADVLPAFDRPTTWLRLLRYPPAPAMRPDDLYGSAPHTDFGCLTILAQDDAGGLQVRTPAGTWIDVPPRRHAFVVNVGDMLNRWSNGVLKSTPHRVINRSGGERYSCPFFYDPNVATHIAPLPSCLGPDRPAGFEPVHFGSFLKAELEAAYDRHRPETGP